MKILLISPASGGWRSIARKRIFNGRAFRFSMLSLLTLAALSPKDAEIVIVDEQVEDLPLDEDFDLVGITVMTATAPRAYEISRHFRRRGLPVVLGGFHPTLNTAEALGHADTVVSGSAYGAWQALLRDLEEGSLKRVYRGHPGRGMPRSLPRRLMKKKHYVTVNATFATIGCRNGCLFCSINKFYRQRRYLRSVEDIFEEIRGFRGNFFIFVDDNLTQDRDYALSLLEGLAPLGKKWVTQASVEIADDGELLDRLKRAGCVGLFVGLESFSDEVLRSQDKEIKSVEHYKKAVRRIHERGIFVESGIIFGFDGDDRSVFSRTLKMLEEINIDAIQASIFTPIPGTPVFESMKDRIVDRNWEDYDYRHAVFLPQKMSRLELQNGTDWVIKSFYSPLSIFRRFMRWSLMPGGFRNFIYPLALNIAYYGRLKRFRIKGFDPLEERRAFSAFFMEWLADALLWLQRNQRIRIQRH